MALFGSTSPAYPIMVSLDLAREWEMKNGRREWQRLAQRVEKMKDTAKKKGLLVPEGKTDPTRLAVGTLPLGMTGQKAAEYFRSQGIEPEHEDGAYVVCITNPLHTQEELDQLEKAIQTLPGFPCPLEENPAIPSLPPVKKSPREAVLAFQERVPLLEAVGRIAGEAACPCPPGVPIVMPGEEITKECMEFLNRYSLDEIFVLK